MKLIYKIEEVFPKIYWINIQDRYDLCMMFLRYQEFYESPNPNFRNNSFQIIEFMDWYSKKYGDGVFTYPVDWSGFNFPGKIIKQVWDKGILDRNIYDYEMKMIYDNISVKAEDFYIIGSQEKDDTLLHEIAHGLYYTNPSYKNKCDELTNDLDGKLYKNICKYLSKLGYDESVFMDETQAYLSTGFPDNFKYDHKKEAKKYKKLFFNYIK